MALTAEEKRRIIEMLDKMDHDRRLLNDEEIEALKNAGKFILDVGKDVAIGVLSHIITDDINKT